jgi:cytochrome P450
MTEEEVLGEAMDVLFGGLDTVASMLGFIIRFLACQPAHRQRLLEDPKKIPIAIEEMFRRHGVATVARRVIADIEAAGVTMRRGDMVVLPTCLHGVDERIWEDPLTVDFDRRRRTHATFGTGIHTCPGAPLARSEIAIVLEEWLNRIPDFRISEGDTGEGLSGAVNALASLDLEWPLDAAAAAPSHG